MSEISMWQVTKNPPWSVKQNVLAHVTKKAEGICGFRWHSHPVLSCLLAWFFSLMNSQVILRYAHSYKMAASSPHGYIRPVCIVPVRVILTPVPLSQLSLQGLWFCPSLSQREKIIPFLPLMWGCVAQSCGHHPVTMGGTSWQLNMEDTRALRMDKNLGSGWCSLVVELTSSGLGWLYEIINCLIAQGVISWVVYYLEPKVT